VARVLGEDAGKRVEVEVNESVDLMGYASLSRFGVSGEDESLILQPALADRSFVSTPERPFYVPAGEEVTIYVSTPLWVQLFVGKESRMLDELPIRRPADTWFGPNTQTGEVCYASRTFCRLQFDPQQTRPYRATTSVLVKNKANSSLYLDRIQLPVPYLSIYCEPSGVDLWTNDVVLERVEGDDLVPLHVQADAPASAPRAVMVAQPRQQAGESIMIRAFETFFANHGGA